jgi:hypothetical protein
MHVCIIPHSCDTRVVPGFSDTPALTSTALDSSCEPSSELHEVVEELVEWYDCQETEEWWEECNEHVEHLEQDRIEDGGGLSSTADWSTGAPSYDCFAGLRSRWMNRVQEWDLVKRLQKGCSKGGPGLLSDSEIEAVRSDAVRFLEEHKILVSDVVEPGQPFTLEIIRGLLCLGGDADQGLPELLTKGISTGIWDDIAPSGMFQAEDRANRMRPEWTDIRSCFENWSSAEENEDQVEALLQQEVQQGWVERWSGTWADAVSRWGSRAICGKLALVKSEGRDDRLIGDSSAPGASPNARFPERIRHPRVADIEKGIAICREEEGKDGEAWCAITLDVSAAHKRLKMRESDAGAAFFSCKGALYRYLVAHFGAAWSAWWWSRTAAMLLRIVHMFLGCAHLAFVYVDDFLILVKEGRAWETACLLAILFSCLGVPLSWHKLEVGRRVKYLGLIIDLSAFTLGLGSDKIAKMKGFLKDIVKGNRLDKRSFRKSLGVLQWASGVALSLRPWLAALYRNLNVPSLAWVSGTPAKLHEVLRKIQDDGCLLESIPGTGAKAGMRLKFIGRSSVSDPSIWRNWWPSKKTSLGFISWDNRRLKVSQESHGVARLWEQCISKGPWIHQCRLRSWVGGECAADAWAAGDSASIGGWWMSEGSLVPDQCQWFSLEIHRSDIEGYVSLGVDMGSDIAFFEALAQVVLLVLMGAMDGALGGGRVLMLCDNEGVVGAAAKGMSTAQPLCSALQCLAAWEHLLDIKTVIQHIPGEDNVLADALSRWKKKQHILRDLDMGNQHFVDLSVVFTPLHASQPCLR